MEILFILLFVGSIVGLVIGLANPSSLKLKSRREASFLFGGAIIVSFVLIGTATPSVPPTNAPVENVPSQVAANNVSQPTVTTTATSTPAGNTSVPTPTPTSRTAQTESTGNNDQQTSEKSSPAQSQGNALSQNQTQQAPRAEAPTANIAANGSQNSVTIPYNTAVTISWNSTNADFCDISPSGWTGTSGNQSTDNLTSQQTYSLSCSGTGGSASASVTVNVSAPPPPPTPSPITLSGSSQEATQQFALQQGLSIFTLHNSGQRNFIVDLLDGSGNEVSNLANAIGDFSGSQAVNVSNAGSYLLNVQTDGSWSITITQPRVTSASSASSLSGTGNQATQFFNLSSGLHTFTLTNSGSGNFIVDLLDQNGNEVENLENVIGSFNGSTAVHIDNAGPYLLNVQSGDGRSWGNWSIQIQ
jgi:hypothetical protein